mmetsp:Transcript_9629/g.22435  ORF Transcript_9629/g.22435 Transcript_9629/m.22435 type:complete len:502 (+) Transcript_9629:4229-5734(+)
MARQKAFDAAPEVFVGLEVEPAVAFVGVNDPFEVLVGAQRSLHVAAMFKRHAPVFAAVGHQQRHADFLGALHGRGLLDLLGVGVRVGHEALHAVVLPLLADVAPVDAGQQADVGHADPVDGALEQLALRDRTHHGRIAAVAGAHDAGALRVGPASLDGPVQRVGEVVLHRQAPLFPAGAEVLEAVARAAAVLGLQHEVAAAGQELGVRFPRPVGAAHIGAAMHEDDDGRLALDATRRLGDEHGQLLAVAGLDAVVVALAHGGERQIGTGAGQRLQRLVGGLVEVIPRRAQVGQRGHDEVAGLGAAQAFDQVHAARQPGIDIGLDGLHRRVQPYGARGVGLVVNAEQHAAAGFGDEPAGEVVARRGDQRLADGATAVRVESEDGAVAFEALRAQHQAVRPPPDRPGMLAHLCVVVEPRLPTAGLVAAEHLAAAPVHGFDQARLVAPVKHPARCVVGNALAEVLHLAGARVKPRKLSAGGLAVRRPAAAQHDDVAAAVRRYGM